MTILYSNHAAKQMFTRMISTDEIEQVLQNGKMIMDYPEDQPYPSKLVLAFCNERPIHVVSSSFNPDENTTIVITAYEPSLEIWENDFKTRKK